MVDAEGVEVLTVVDVIRALNSRGDPKRSFDILRSDEFGEVSHLYRAAKCVAESYSSEG